MAQNSKNKKYAHLNQLSTKQLEQLLCADIESTESGDSEAILYIMEVIENREQEHPTGLLPDENQAWEEFQTYYNIPGDERVSLYPTEYETSERKVRDNIPHGQIMRLRPKLRLVGTAAAVIVCIFGLMICAQAAGIDVFGAIGRWTEETFHFVTSHTGNVQGVSGTSLASASYTSWQTALDDCGINEKLAPTWYPDGFELSELKVSDTDFGDKVLCNFNGPDDKSFSFQVWRYDLASDLILHTFEKDDSSVEKYTSKKKGFYIMSNIDTTTATWSDARSLVINITGNISINDIKAIIDSIGGRSI